MKYSAEFKDLAAALCKAQAVFPGAVKASHNPHLKTWYADLHSYWEAAREPLSSNGLSVLQPFATENGRVTVTTVLMHVSGQWMSMEASLVPKSGAPAELGTVVAYLRRYSLASMVGLSQEDAENEDTSEDRPEPAQPLVQAPAKVSGSIGSPELVNGRPITQAQKGYAESFYKSVVQVLHDPDAPDAMRASAILDIRNQMNEDPAVFTLVWRRLRSDETKTFKALLEAAEKEIGQ